MECLLECHTCSVILDMCSCIATYSIVIMILNHDLFMITLCAYPNLHEVHHNVPTVDALVPVSGHYKHKLL